MPTVYTFTCATCDHVITGRPVFHIGLTFCCAGCAADGPCMCSYDPVDDARPTLELIDPDEVALVEPVGGRVFLEPPVVQDQIEAPAAVRKDAGQLIGSGR